MQTIETQLHRQYAITATTTCTVTADNGMELCTVHPGEQKIFTAISNFTKASDERAVVSLLFGKFCDNSTTDIPQPCHSGPLQDSLHAGHVYDLGKLTSDTDLSTLCFNASAVVQTSELWFSTENSVITITWPSDAIWVDRGQPTLSAHTAYRFALRQEPNGKLIINLAYEYSV